MALKATVHKLELTISDTNRHHYQTYPLMVACHPSETQGRMALRIAAFALYADDNLAFSRGISATDEPDLWQKSLTGDIEHWIDLGWPDEKRLSKACGQSQKVTILSYGRHGPIWWNAIKDKVDRFKHLRIFYVGEEAIETLAPLMEAKALSATISDDSCWLSTDAVSAEITLAEWKGT